MFSVSRILHFSRNVIIPLEHSLQARCYAIPGLGLGKGKKIGKTRTSTAEKIVLPVETDVNRLLTYCCGTNILKEGGEDVKLKPDSEYPEWLWSIRTGPAPTLEELDPNTKAYWKRLRKDAIKRNNKIRKLRKF